MARVKMYGPGNGILMGLDHGVGHLVSMTPEKTHGSISIGIEIR